MYKRKGSTIRGMIQTWPNFPDKHLPHLSTGSGGNSVRRPFPFGGQLRRARLYPHDAFRRGRCVFAKKNHRGNWQELKVRSIIILGLWTIFLLQKGANGNRKEFSEVRRKNDGLTVIPLPQGLHTQHKSAAALDPGLSERYGSSTWTTNPRSRQPKK
jgi:hypothetical protein